MGFGSNFLAAIKAIYSQPKAQLKVSVLCLFSLARGTRQGDPLSPLLFTLATEPLAESIWQHLFLKGVRVKDREFKLSLYANDLVVYLTNALQLSRPY